MIGTGRDVIGTSVVKKPSFNQNWTTYVVIKCQAENGVKDVLTIHTKTVPSKPITSDSSVQDDPTRDHQEEGSSNKYRTASWGQTRAKHIGRSPGDYPSPSPKLFGAHVEHLNVQMKAAIPAPPHGATSARADGTGENKKVVQQPMAETTPRARKLMLEWTVGESARPRQIGAPLVESRQILNDA
ncbi:hypothetical protein BJ322DRAFT_1017252 [Thelephora terrestris]|uniref:Uncharacterized protein n=1 Tax=Thelephora terrestris TaxID=56493 RepID=A0A9P6HML6_9AGAM|nr:hypothetical protein BJ322DRAFT_1017252 [Thelephora terrestris]